MLGQQKSGECLFRDMFANIKNKKGSQVADTIPDITVVNTSWVNVYSLAGITVGDNLIVTNKSSSPILLV